MIKPELKNLPMSAYSLLDKLGMLYELYPEATGEWDIDCPAPRISAKEKILNIINGLPK